MKFKNIFIRDEKERPLKAVELYEVRWTSRYGEYSGQISLEIEVFTNRFEAELFQRALQDAFKLIKHTSKNNVSLKYRNY